jgi:hypothetical protein
MAGSNEMGGGSVGMPPTVEPLSIQLGEDDLPELFQSADHAAIRGQRNYLREQAAQLLLLVMAAGVAKLSLRFGRTDLDWAQVGAAAAFVSAAILKGWSLSMRHDRLWYEARAVAESTKTLAWRYAVGGEPFRVAFGTREEADRLFIDRLGKLREPLREFPIVPSPSRTEQITRAMRELRSRPLPDRSRAYESRIRDQFLWYVRQAAWNERRGRLWTLVMLTFELAGAILAVLVGTGTVGFNLAGFTATIVGAALAWSNIRQHHGLATAYSVTARELNELRTLPPDLTGEESWARYVEQGEQAISREHTLWRPTRIG